MGKRRTRYKLIDSVEYIRLTDDEEELLDVLSVAHSLEANAEATLNLRRKEVALINARLRKVRGENPSLQITDHAVVRYLERVVGLDIDSVRKDMIAKVPEDHTYDSTPGFIKIDVDGLQYVIRDNIIISVIPTKPKEQNESTDT